MLLLPDRLEPDPAYQAALRWVWSFSEQPRTPAGILADRARKRGRMRALLDALGRPEESFVSILVAGTKGKGSTVAMLASCLGQHTRGVGRYVSPHLLNWRERTSVDGCPISPEEVVRLVAEVRQAVNQLPSALGSFSTFEVGTALSFLHFARCQVRVAVVEVGVGGRFDATNLLDPLVSVITTIGFDHLETLGPTLASIAHHKAGILRPGRVAISATQPTEALQAVRAEAARLGSRLQLVGSDWTWSRVDPGRDPREMIVRRVGRPAEERRFRVPLLGDHQRENATAATAALAALSEAAPALGVTAAELGRGMQGLEWPGRLQVVREHPAIVVDSAHNGVSARAVAATLEAEFRYQRLLLVVGMTAHHDARALSEALAPRADGVYVTRSGHDRAIAPGEIADTIRDVVPGRPVNVMEDPGSALDRAVADAGPRDLVLVVGSVFLAGEALYWASRSAP